MSSIVTINTRGRKLARECFALLVICVSFPSADVSAQELTPTAIRARQDLAQCTAELNAIPMAAGNANRVLNRRRGCIIEDKELRAQYWEATESKLAAIAKLDAALLGDVAKKHAQEIKALGFPDAFLKATIYLQPDMYNRPRAWMPLETWLARLFESGSYASITRITTGRSQGVMLKRQGVQSGGILFVLDGGDLFPSHSAGNGKVDPIESVGEQVSVATAITQSISP